jgi:hypothetical protein
MFWVRSAKLKRDSSTSRARFPQNPSVLHFRVNPSGARFPQDIHPYYTIRDNPSAWRYNNRAN